MRFKNLCKEFIAKSIISVRIEPRNLFTYPRRSSPQFDYRGMWFI